MDNKALLNILADESKQQDLVENLLDKMNKEGKTLKEVLNVDDSFLEQVYSLAYAHYNQGKYKESASLFHFLAGIEPTSYNYVFSLAASFYQLKDYENAFHGFYFALNLDLTNPWPAYYIADSMLKLGIKDSGREFLEICIDIAGDQPQYTVLKERCRLIAETLRNCK